MDSPTMEEEMEILEVDSQEKTPTPTLTIGKVLDLLPKKNQGDFVCLNINSLNLADK